jgi:hypothetical protein
MRIRDIKIADILAGRNWRLLDSSVIEQSMTDWEIEVFSAFQPTDTVVYSALSILANGEVQPIVLVREVGTYDWWGDTCEYVAGGWRELGSGATTLESYAASPLPDDPSFSGEYSHDKQRAGFALWSKKVREGREIPPVS